MKYVVEIVGGTIFLKVEQNCRFEMSGCGIRKEIMSFYYKD